MQFHTRFYARFLCVFPRCARHSLFELECALECVNAQIHGFQLHLSIAWGLSAFCANCGSFDSGDCWSVFGIGESLFVIWIPSFVAVTEITWEDRGCCFSASWTWRKIFGFVGLDFVQGRYMCKSFCVWSATRDLSFHFFVSFFSVSSSWSPDSDVRISRSVEAAFLSYRQRQDFHRHVICFFDLEVVRDSLLSLPSCSSYLPFRALLWPMSQPANRNALCVRWLPALSLPVTLTRDSFSASSAPFTPLLCSWSWITCGVSSKTEILDGATICSITSRTRNFCWCRVYDAHLICTGFFGGSILREF